MSRSSSGLARVSNLGDIEITCHVRGAAIPDQAGETRVSKQPPPLTKLSPDGRKKLVPSEVHEDGGGGGGFGPDPQPEWIDFYVHIPLDSAERDAEARRYLAKSRSQWHRSKLRGSFTAGAGTDS